MTWSHSLLGLLLASGFTLGVACNSPYGSTTDAAEGGDTDSACPVGSAGCACTGGGSCDPGLLCASMRCVDPDQEVTTSMVETSTGPTTDGGTTGDPACNPGGAGSNDPACVEPGKPYCLAGACVGCSALECEAVSPSLPFCDPGTGLCAACLCDDATPVCDPIAHTCSKCDAHTDCPDSACDLEFGACMPAAATLWVGGVICSDDGDGAKATPLCGLDEAFARIKNGAATSVALRVKAGDYSVAGPLLVPADRVIALVSADDMKNGLAIGIASAKAPAVAVEPQGRLLIDGVELDKSSDGGLACRQGAMWLDRLTVSNAAGHGVTSEGCTVTMRRSVLVGNTIAGVQILGGKLRVENSFISSNGNFEVPGGGVYLGDGASLDAVYTTFVDNIAAAGNPFSVACDADTAKESVTLRNSVAINKGQNTLCEGASVATTAWTTGAPGVKNIAVDFPSLGMYLEADPEIAGVYRAIPGSKLDALAMWQDGDPRVDFDGDARPDGDNSPDFAGADRAAM